MKLARPAVAVAVAVSALLAASANAVPSAGRPVFAPPVRLTPDGFGGFEPVMTLDRAGNVWVTAHRTYSPESPSATDRAPLRGGSWLWLSKDGRSFNSPPGATPAAEEYSQFASAASEGDVAVDGTGNAYFVDLAPAGIALTSWKVNGPGAVQETYTTPQSTALLAIDRPFIAAGGNGTLLVTHLGAGSSPGPYGVHTYISRDGGRSFEQPLGTSLPVAANFCRPLIDRRNVLRMVLLCVPGPGGAVRDLITGTTADGGRTWTYGTIHNAYGGDHGSNVVMPSLKQAPDGTLYGLAHQFIGGEIPSSVKLALVTSHDMGKTWTTRDVTPEPGIWEDSSIAVAPDGRLAVSGYYRPKQHTPWSFHIATFRAGDRTISSVRVGPAVAYPITEDTVPGEMTQAEFGRDGKLRVTYAVRELAAIQPLTDQNNRNLGSSTIFYAQQR